MSTYSRTPSTEPSGREQVRRALNVVDVDELIALENGECSNDQVIDIFQRLINSGLAWQLQGSYGRTARNLILAGYCHPAE